MCHQETEKVEQTARVKTMGLKEIIFFEYLFLLKTSLLLNWYSKAYFGV